MGTEDKAGRQSRRILCCFALAWLKTQNHADQERLAEGRPVSFLLDTNVVSEWVRQRPDPGVVAWLADVDEDRVFISVITLAELRYGIESMSDGARRRRLAEWLQHELPQRFEGRVLSVDDSI